MRRRDFIKVVASAVAPWPLPLRAQQATKVYCIGYLGVTTRAEYAREIEALLRGLHQLGYEEGKILPSTIDLPREITPCA